jgi:phosphoribosyl-ATP pyrophosphohydrolase
MAKGDKRPAKRAQKRGAASEIAQSLAGNGKRAGINVGMQVEQPGESAEVLDRLWNVVMSRRSADVAVSHSARLLSRGTSKVAQKFGEEAVECLIEAVAGNRDALVAESADVLYHLIVLWVDAGIAPADVWRELRLREGVSGIAEKASRARSLPLAFGVKSTKIP